MDYDINVFNVDIYVHLDFNVYVNIDEFVVDFNEHFDFDFHVDLDLNFLDNHVGIV